MSRRLCQTHGHRRPPLPVAAIAFPYPAASCFSDRESRNFHRLHLISFGLARTRVCARAEALALRANASAAPPQLAVRGSVDLVLLGDGLSQTLPVLHA